MKEKLQGQIIKSLNRLGITETSFTLEYPENPDHGDFSSNVAMVTFKKFAGLVDSHIGKISWVIEKSKIPKNPKEMAELIIVELKKGQPDFVQSITIAGPGFINFKIKDKIFAENVVTIAKNGKEYGWNNSDSGKKIMVEYTDPNPFKVFHIGHLMSNAVGESISRLIQSSGGNVIRACYQGDVGLHVAKTIWAILKKQGFENWRLGIGEKTVTEKVKWLGEMYVYGAKFDDDATAQKEIAMINKEIFGKSDPKINEIYEQGRKWSLEYFDLIYERLGTKFDQFFFESEVATDGVKVVREFIKKGVFTESEGAIIFKGEDYDLHTRVFITSQGLPTYEAKEIGLNIEKFKKYPDLDGSIIVTANEQGDYFKVLLKAFSLIDQNIFTKTKHISHGLLRFSSGKMSSRKGNIVSAESLLEDIRELVAKKIAVRELSLTDKNEISDIVAIGAIKYTILRQSIGGDVIFDSTKSISFEGDSGPYLQYSAVRAAAVLEKARIQDSRFKIQNESIPSEVTLLEKLIFRFPDIVERAREEYSPQQVANYLVNLAGAFNNYYAVQTIIDEKDPQSSYRLALTQAFLTTMTNGLWILGIKVPKKM
ncbi:MAG: arginine--tRNA ligase [Patescibacteria group bacterium]